MHRRYHSFLNMAAIRTASPLVLLLFAISVASVTSSTFNVVKFGARAKGNVDNKQAFLKAWAAACDSRGTNVVVVPNGVFGLGVVSFLGPCKGRMVFQVSGTIRAPDDLNKFSGINWIVFQYLDGFKLTGQGTFDGRGQSAWSHNKCRRSKHCKALPTSIQFSSVDNSVVEGIKSLNSKMFHIMVYRCNNLLIQSITVKAPENSPNTDGIHVGLSKHVTISHSHIGTGDDCISIGPSNSDITVKGVHCGPGHGISVGSLGRYGWEKDVSNLYVKDCTLSGTMNGVRIKTWENSKQLSARNFTFDNIVMYKVGNPIIIDQEYCPSGRCGSLPPSKVKISNIKFRNIRGTSSTPLAVTLKCSGSVPCKYIELKNINLRYSGRGNAKSICKNVHGLTKGNVYPSL